MHVVAAVFVAVLLINVVLRRRRSSFVNNLVLRLSGRACQQHDLTAFAYLCAWMPA